MTSSASATWRTAARRAKALVAGLSLLAIAAPGRAQDASLPTEFELGRSVQRSLARVQESWLQWVGVSLQDSEARADEALRNLTIAVREIGFKYLPDLALAAVAQARQSIREGNFARAERQLDAAETLDPRNPEIAFGRATLARARGNWSDAASAWIAGVGSTLTTRGAAKAQASVLLWLLLVAMTSFGLFVALLAWRHGGSAIAALRGVLSPPVPEWATAGVVAFVVVAPLALPSGLTWMLWLWSILLWSFASRSERAILAVGWLMLAVVPAIADRTVRELALDQTPPMRAWQAFENGRLYGGFFADAQVLRSALPDHPAALEFAADVHRTLGQWDVARSLYRRTLLAEPQNVPVLLNLGAYSFRKGDYAVANAYFQRATETPVASAAAWFNLSLGFSESYLFDDSREALGHAREVDGAAVDLWMATPNPDRVLTFNASLGRRDEVRRALLAAWRQPGIGRLAGLPAGVGGAVLALLAVALAYGFHALHDLPSGARRDATPPIGSVRLRAWTEMLLPAVGAARRGAGGAAWANLALLAAIVLLPLLFELAGDLPVPSWPGPRTAAVVAILAAIGYVGVCARHGVEARGD